MVRVSVTTYFRCFKPLFGFLQRNATMKRAAPGLNCPPKLWWVKEISPDLHVSGRLSERQLKYAAEGGFKSVVCLDINKPGIFGGETLPGMSAVASISTITQLQTKFINTTSKLSESLKDLEDVFSTLDKPILLTGNNEKTAVFLGLLYFASRDSSGSSLKSEAIYSIAASMGYDFKDETSKSIVARVIGEPVINSPRKPDIESNSILHYWLAHRIGKNWYTAGQIRRQELPELENAGFKSLINMRMGVEYANTASQEPVTLLNIKDSLATYDETRKPTRLNPKLLEENRVFPDVPPNYVDDSATVNYESTNPDEFGDEIGYNENIERDFVQKNTSLNYKHIPLPLPKDVYTREMFEEFKDDLLSADKDGPVLLHCRIGRRAAYFGILALAMKEGRSLQWAQRRSIEMGHEVSKEARPDIFDIYQQYLKSE